MEIDKTIVLENLESALEGQFKKAYAGLNINDSDYFFKERTLFISLLLWSSGFLKYTDVPFSETFDLIEDLHEKFKRCFRG